MNGPVTNELYLREEFASAWRGRDPYAQVRALQGKVYREVKNRRTLQFDFQGRSYFVKHHLGAGWREIIKNLLQLRLPVLSAQNEWQAVKKLQELDIGTMRIAAYGKKGGNPAQLESFIITDDLHNTVSLEDYCAEWPRRAPAFRFKRQLIRELARISRTLHEHGVCHRDYYLCHFLLQRETDGSIDESRVPRLALIDLHRALIRKKLSRRWIEKDLAGLYFSAMKIGLSRTDLARFVTCYDASNPRAAQSRRVDFWLRVQKKAHKLAAREQRKQARRIAGREQA